MVSEDVDFDHHRWGEVVTVKRIDPEHVNWVNILLNDLANRVGLLYDHNYLSDPLPEAVYGPDPYSPYSAAIVFHSLEQKGKKLSSRNEYGSFYYDANGQLRVIKAGQLTHSGFESDVPTFNFRRMQNGDWSVYRITDVNEPMLTYVARGEIIEPLPNTLINGQKLELDELITSLTETNGRMKFHQETMTGHKWKTIEVPSAINILRWKSVLSSLNGEWAKVFTQFPSQIEAVV